MAEIQYGDRIFTFVNADELEQIEAEIKRMYGNHRDEMMAIDCSESERTPILVKNLLSITARKYDDAMHQIEIEKKSSPRRCSNG